HRSAGSIPGESIALITVAAPARPTNCELRSGNSPAHSALPLASDLPVPRRGSPLWRAYNAYYSGSTSFVYKLAIE
ncbi:MAG: hypothetical protein ACREQ3_25625, partial [Candidatus Binatia bacterium]